LPHALEIGVPREFHRELNLLVIHLGDDGNDDVHPDEEDNEEEEGEQDGCQDAVFLQRTRFYWGEEGERMPDSYESTAVGQCSIIICSQWPIIASHAVQKHALKRSRKPL
jgi:hypothetical protein